MRVRPFPLVALLAIFRPNLVGEPSWVAWAAPDEERRRPLSQTPVPFRAGHTGIHANFVSECALWTKFTFFQSCVRAVLAL